MCAEHNLISIFNVFCNVIQNSGKIYKDTLYKQIFIGSAMSFEEALEIMGFDIRVWSSEYYFPDIRHSYSIVEMPVGAHVGTGEYRSKYLYDSNGFQLSRVYKGDIAGCCYEGQRFAVGVFCEYFCYNRLCFGIVKEFLPDWNFKLVGWVKEAGGLCETIVPLSNMFAPTYYVRPSVRRKLQGLLRVPR